MNFKNRWWSHIKGAIYSFKQSRKPSLKNAIRIALDMAFNDPSSDLFNMDHLILQTKLLHDFHKTKIKILAAMDIYFNNKILEFHRYYETVFKGEKAQISKKGTFLTGLNRIKGQSKGYIPMSVRVPIYDIAMLLSLGATIKDITKLINIHYKDLKLDLNEEQIRSIIRLNMDSISNMQEELYKPIIIDLRQAQQDHSNILALYGDKLRIGPYQTWYNRYLKGEIDLVSMKT